MQNLRPSNIKVIFQRSSCGSPIAVASGTAPVTTSHPRARPPLPLSPAVAYPPPPASAVQPPPPLPEKHRRFWRTLAFYLENLNPDFGFFNANRQSLGPNRDSENLKKITIPRFEKIALKVKKTHCRLGIFSRCRRP